MPKFLDLAFYAIIIVVVIENEFSFVYFCFYFETGCSGLVHWDDPEGWDGEGSGRGAQDGEHMYTHG